MNAQETSDDRAIAVFLEDIKEHKCATCHQAALRIISRLRHAELAARMNAETIKNMVRETRTLGDRITEVNRS